MLSNVNHKYKNTTNGDEASLNSLLPSTQDTSKEITMALQIQGVPPFNPNGDQTSLSQRCTKWVKGFNYFITASGINNNDRKHALLLHMVGVNDQNNNKLDTALTAFNTISKQRKTFPLRDLSSVMPIKTRERSLIRHTSKTTRPAL